MNFTETMQFRLGSLVGTDYSLLVLKTLIQQEAKIMKHVTVLTGIALTFFAPRLDADDFTWSGLGDTADFSNGSNWVGGSAPSHTTEHNYLFTGSSNTTVVLSSTTNGPIIVNLTFDENAGSFDLSPVSFSVSGNRFRVKSDTPVSFVQNSANNQRISATLSQSGNNGVAPITISGSGSGSLTLDSFRFGASGTQTNILNIERDVNIGQITRVTSDAPNASLVFNTSLGTTTNVSGVMAGTTTDTTTAFRLEKSGEGKLVLSGSSLNTGATNVTGGTLLINGYQSNGTGPLTLNASTTLGGIGSVGGMTTVYGTLKAGDGGVGLLNFEDALTLMTDSISVFHINGLLRGGEHDAIGVNGNLTFGGTLSLNFGFAAEVDQEFDLFDFGGSTGDFDSISFVNSGYDGTFDAVTGILRLTAVPEPGAAILIGMAGTLSLLRRSRKQTSAV